MGIWGWGGQRGVGGQADVHTFSLLCAVLTVLRAFPCRSRLGDADTAAAMEEEVRRHTGWAGWTQLSWLLCPGSLQSQCLKHVYEPLSPPGT